jgi:hypothetical protein
MLAASIVLFGKEMNKLHIHPADAVDGFLQGKKFLPIVTAAFFTLLTFQILAICYINLFQSHNHLGFDASAYYLKAIEMWRQKTLFIQNWHDQTTLFIDSPVPLAALLYGMTRNIFVAYGLANILCAAALIYVLYTLLEEMQLDKTSRLIALNLLLTPYITSNFDLNNDLLYFHMLYAGAAMYVVKACLCFLIMKLTLKFYRPTCFDRKTLALTCVTALLALISGVSSGYFLLVFAVAPCFFFLFVQMIARGDSKQLLNRAILWLLAVSLLLKLGKTFARSYLRFKPPDLTSKLTGETEFFRNIEGIYLGFCELFGTMSRHSDTVAFSKNGFPYLVAWCIFLILSAGVLYKILETRKLEIDKLPPTTAIILCVIGMHVLMLTLLYTKYGQPFFESRYLIPAMVALILIFAKFINDLPLESYLRKFLVMILLVAISISSVKSHVHYNKTTVASYYNKFRKIFEQVDAPLVLGTDIILIRNLRVWDTNRIYKAGKFEDGKGYAANWHHWGDYTYYDDLGTYHGKIAFLCKQEEFEKASQSLRALFQQKNDVGSGYFVYVGNK